MLRLSMLLPQQQQELMSLQQQQRMMQMTGVASPWVNISLASFKKMYLEGEEQEEVEPGVFTRSRHSLPRQSINIIIKNQTRSKQYCMFYNKFGKCTSYHNHIQCDHF